MEYFRDIFQQEISKYLDIKEYLIISSLNNDYRKNIKKVDKFCYQEEIMKCCENGEIDIARVLLNLYPNMDISELDKKFIRKLIFQQKITIDILIFLLEINNLDIHFDVNTVYYFSIWYHEPYFLEKLFVLDSYFSKKEWVKMFNAAIRSSKYGMVKIIMKYCKYDLINNENGKDIFIMNSFYDKDIKGMEFIYQYLKENTTIDTMEICMEIFNEIIDNRLWMETTKDIVEFLHDRYSGIYDYYKLLYLSMKDNNIYPELLEWLLSDEIFVYIYNKCDWEYVKELYINNPMKYIKPMKLLLTILEKKTNISDNDYDINEKYNKDHIDIDDELCMYKGEYILVNEYNINCYGYYVYRDEWLEYCEYF